MSDATLTLLIVAAGTYLFKAAGPLVLGGRTLPPGLNRLIELLPGALIAALVVVSSIGDGQGITLDARLVGVAVAAIALWKKLPFVVVVVLACIATALVRALG